MEWRLYCSLKQRKCKRGVNCLHISFREQMGREMHFTGASAAGVCLASERSLAVWCRTFVPLPSGSRIISADECWPRGKGRGQGGSAGGRLELLLRSFILSPFSVPSTPTHPTTSSLAFTCLCGTHAPDPIPLSSTQISHDLVYHGRLCSPMLDLSSCSINRVSRMCVCIFVRCMCPFG